MTGRKRVERRRGQYGIEIIEKTFLASDLSLGGGKKEMIRGLPPSLDKLLWFISRVLNN
jgi:hypothetical protein